VTAGPTRPDALLLDLDGTLVLSERVHRHTWEHFFDTWSVEVDEGEYQRSYMGRRAGDVLAQVPGPWTGTDLTEAVRAMTRHALTLGDQVEVVPGAAELVRLAAAAGVPVAVVTSAGQEWAERVLGPVLGIRDLIAALVTAEQVQTGKPAPEGYARACALLGVDPARSVGVEDSPSGLRALAAAEVGVLVGIATTAEETALQTAGAHLTVLDLAAPALRSLLWPTGARPGRGAGRGGTGPTPTGHALRRP
jgi:sugar-phosphatase